MLRFETPLIKHALMSVMFSAAPTTFCLEIKGSKNQFQSSVTYVYGRFLFAESGRCVSPFLFHQMSATIILWRRALEI